MLRTWHKAALFDPRKGSAFGWVFRIARNQRATMLAKRAHTPAARETAADDTCFVTALETEPSAYPAGGPGQTNDVADGLSEPERKLLAKQTQARVHRAIAALPQDQAQALHLVYFDQDTLERAATRQGVPVGTMKSRVRLAFSRLRVNLAEGEN